MPFPQHAKARTANMQIVDEYRNIIGVVAWATAQAARGGKRADRFHADAPEQLGHRLDRRAGTCPAATSR